MGSIKISKIPQALVNWPAPSLRHSFQNKLRAPHPRMVQYLARCQRASASTKSLQNPEGRVWSIFRASSRIKVALKPRPIAQSVPAFIAYRVIYSGQAAFFLVESKPFPYLLRSYKKFDFYSLYSIIPCMCKWISNQWDSVMILYFIVQLPSFLDLVGDDQLSLRHQSNESLYI